MKGNKIFNSNIKLAEIGIIIMILIWKHKMEISYLKIFKKQDKIYRLSTTIK